MPILPATPQDLRCPPFALSEEIEVNRAAYHASVGIALALLGTLVQPLHAQSNAERITNDSYTRSHDYDLVHQRVELRDFDWDSTSFQGRVETTLIALRPSLDSIVLDAGHLLGIGSVTDTKGASLRQTRHGDTLVVHLPAAAAFGDTLRFTIDYRGKVDNGRGLTFIQPEGRPHRPRQIWSQGEAMNNHDWFPTYDFPNDRETWELVATVPNGYTAVSNGDLADDHANPDGTRTMHWSQRQPAPTYLVSLIVAPLEKIHDEWQGKPVDYYVYAEDVAEAKPLFAITPDMIQVYSDLTGVPYPWSKYAQTTVADFFGGMENVSATTLVDWLPDARAYADRPWYQWILIPHELAHQWFGDYVTTENWANTWLNEGFAEFLPGQYWRVRGGEHLGEDYYIDEYQQFIGIDARRSMPLAAQGSNNIYPKGALVLEMLHDYLGDAPFWASLNRYLTDHALDNATTNDLRQAILDATGENLSWFFDQWVYQAGIPAFNVTARYDAAAKRVVLVATQTQGDSAVSDAAEDSTAPRFTTPHVFRMPVTVRVGTAGGDVVAQADIDQRVDTITVDGVGAPPTMVVFDDGNHILKTLSFQQPTAWLATQLRHDSNLWNRAWAIDQLAERSNDGDAARALAGAATSADYYLTRARAAGALAAFDQNHAMSALKDALRDTSAQVRAAAIHAIGAVGGRQAAHLARTAFIQDSSYTVRAAAVLAIASADSLNAQPDLRRALGTASYREAIRQAALQAIGSVGDESFIDTLQALVGEDPNAAFSLGALAARGSNEALDLLSEDLNDPRPEVRRWALSAIANRLQPGVAIARLKAAAEDLDYPDTKLAIERVVQQLGRPRR